MKRGKRAAAWLLAGIVLLGCTACAKREPEQTKTAVTPQPDDAMVLSNTVTTKFGDKNAVTYPRFRFDHPDTWTVSKEEVTAETEQVTLTNDRGAEIHFSYYAYPRDFNFGTSAVNMSRVEITKVCDAGFVPGLVQGTDHSGLGPFMVAALKVTGQMDTKTDQDFTAVDGPVSYAVLPASWAGTKDIRGPLEGEAAFWYSGYLSFVAGAPQEGFTEKETQEIQQILASFKCE